MDRLKWSLGFSKGVAVDCKGKSGGLALWWRDHVEVTVRPWCQYYTDAAIVCDGASFRFTGIYGEPCIDKRTKTWEILRYLSAQDNLPWLCAGDFNEALKQDEQQGSNPRRRRQMELFEDCLSDCGLADLGFSGYPFAWDNKREHGDNIQVRLDRATCNGDFAHLFPSIEAQHVMTEESDHQALIIKALVMAGESRARGHRSFMYEAAWARHEDYEAMVAATWGVAHAANQHEGRLATTFNSLKAATRSMQEWS
ncbi:uncharacterized protein [Aegilops tauschii subsp. strangulata]|uniref:uncharacterized protein n=1 Tax=Aegilops tauschii subsp. strangulata TaxID=200361 RepID=UPI003CC8D067